MGKSSLYIISNKSHTLFITHYKYQVFTLVVVILTCCFFAILGQSVVAITAVVAFQVVAIQTGSWWSTVTAVTAPFRLVAGSINWTLALWLSFRDSFWVFCAYKKIARLNWDAYSLEERPYSRYEQFETSPETIEQELRPAVCEQQQTDLRIIRA